VGTPLDALRRLIDRFDQDRKVFLSPDYNEEQLVEDAYRYRPSASASSGRRPVSASKVVGREPEAESGRLGEVYEQFLGLSACGHAQAGKVVRLAVDHQAKVEEKPEVPKAGELRPTPLTWRREEVILTLRIEVSYEDTR